MRGLIRMRISFYRRNDDSLYYTLLSFLPCFIPSALLHVLRSSHTHVMSKFWIKFVLHPALSIKCICHPSKHTNVRFQRKAVRLYETDDAYIPSSVLFKMTIQQATSQQAAAGPPVTLNFSLPACFKLLMESAVTDGGCLNRVPKSVLAEITFGAPVIAAIAANTHVVRETSRQNWFIVDHIAMPAPWYDPQNTWCNFKNKYNLVLGC